MKGGCEIVTQPPWTQTKRTVIYEKKCKQRNHGSVSKTKGSNQCKHLLHTRGPQLGEIISEGLLGHLLFFSIKQIIRPHLQKSHYNGSNKGHGQFQQKSCTLDVQNLKNGLKFVFIIGHQRKSHFCTFSCINPGFGGPWDMLQKKILIAIFIMLQKNDFGQKIF